MGRGVETVHFHHSLVDRSSSHFIRLPRSRVSRFFALFASFAVSFLSFLSPVCPSSSSMSGFIPVNGPVLLNTHGSPNQGAYLPAGALGASAAGFVTTQHGEKGHHTVVHPVIFQAPPPPPPQTIIHEVVKEVPVPVTVPSPAPSQPAPVNIKINNTTPGQEQAPTTINNSAAPALPQRPLAPGTTQQTTTTTTAAGMGALPAQTTSTTTTAAM
jgi:hypothetical protein